MLNFNQYEQVALERNEDEEGKVLSNCKYFESVVYEANGETKIPIDDSKFNSIVCIKGNGTMELQDSKMEIVAW
ncbi:hypothetical protein [Desulfosporosinus sp. Sb-LF]|uniref:hypothetical protein n=1 Tax=Desulfosporosinus sp. Sb-LF TaxID=2560027 RepID=UPI00107FA848|nr:hypothetical protein [Desulfosporosinus sp. Sb-LF]TGE31905.1 hypothetical protein E4K68_14530 [Desulfosporosinus sp. Sb-LF]